MEKLQILTGALIILMFNPQMDSMLDAKEIARTYKILRRRLWLLLLLTWVNKYNVFQNLFWRFSPSSEITLESGGK
jgi:hypothetical protein